MATFFLGARAAPGRERFFTDDELSVVHEFYAREKDATPTPLRRLPALAADLGVGQILVKDESSRFGLPSFKIAGARYAIATLIAQRGSAVRELACATAGNHGRAVARVARERGLGTHIYVPAGTAPARIDALRSEGADVTVTDRDYDATVELMGRDAAARAWTIVSDTSLTGEEPIPRWIMAGYTRILEEAAGAWDGPPPDIFIVQAGVGSLAGALAGWLDARFGTDGPRLVVAEPEGSACVQASLRAGRPVRLGKCAPTAMVGLRCAAVSPLAWRALRERMDAALGVPEPLSGQATARLANPLGDDPAIPAGASGACGLAALMALTQDPDLVPVRRALTMTRRTRVLLFVTEGVTDRS